MLLLGLCGVLVFANPNYSVRREKTLFFSGKQTRPATGRSSR